MVTTENIIEVLPEVCKRFRIKYVEIFGSLAQGKLSDESDIDLLIELEEPIGEKSAERYFGFLHFMEDRFGRKVDLLTPRSIKNPFLKRSIERKKIRVYG